MLKTIARLAKIIALLDGECRVTQEGLAASLGVSIRTIRYDLTTLQDLGCPLVFSHSNGWELDDDWDLWESLKTFVEEINHA